MNSSQEPESPPEVHKGNHALKGRDSRPLLEDLTPHLHEVRSPGQYTGGEWNAVVKSFSETTLKVALAFPDTYAMGMSSQGLQLVYHLFNRRDDTLAERFFAPELDMEALLRREGIPLFSLESHRPMASFDLAAFSLQYELLLTNVLSMLDLSGLPLLARDREEGMPLVVAGGGGVSAPEVSAPFFDVLLLGDGEVIVDPLVRTVTRALREGRRRKEIIGALAEEVPGAYAPSLYRRRPSASGFLIPEPMEGTGAPERIRPAISEDLDAAPLANRPIVPNV
ncbi:MAG: B12-binding domain-containing radical SAM protein, partial [Planctomycetota bacterium]